MSHLNAPTDLPTYEPYRIFFLKEIAIRNPICEALNYCKNHVLIIYTRHG
jgi:hypothetical protein